MPSISHRLLASVAAWAIGCASGSPAPLVIAHRGASGLAPEHTLAAYDLALELGADYLEQDLQVTRDGVVVVLHDERLERTARGPAESCTGPVHDKSLAALETCDFGRWFDERSSGAGSRFAGQRVVTLEALFQRYGREARYYIETKHPEQAPGLEEALVSLLAAHDLLPRAGEAPRVIVQSFSPESLHVVRALEPGLPLVQLLPQSLEAPLEDVLTAVAGYADGIAPHFSAVDAELMAAAGRHGLLVHAYTVNEPEEMVRLLDLGVDGLFTDRPDLLLELLRER